MTHHHILIIYGTTYGHTKTIAARMKDVLTGDGLRVTTLAAADLPQEFDPSVYDGVVVGASVIRGKHQRAIERFVLRHLETLNRVPSAFVSVSGSAGSADPQRQSDARQLMEHWLDSLAWHPDLMTTLGGAYTFSRYPWPLRWLVQLVTKGTGGPTDSTRDQCFTDWEHVEDFAHRFARIVEPVNFVAPDTLGATI